MKFKNRLFTVRKLLTQFCKKSFLEYQLCPWHSFGYYSGSIPGVLGNISEDTTSKNPSPCGAYIFPGQLAGFSAKGQADIYPH